ncbi:Transcription elongation regulator 1-like protein [Sciurus carolinensis]|uniref:Transcription elongation regulator 1-like protein n=1 Tax=Sciurus carolinensis TaxID=30640 RepID=A0AA41SZN6_SCICA|nr:Transcription elongation regulator 1-like protein [Sciurus carolinensis]
MLAGARLQRRRRQLQQHQQPRRRQPFLWPMNADLPPPPWVWMVPGAAGLLRLGPGVAPPPLLLASAQPAAAPLLPGLPGWQAPGEPLLPLLPLPSAPDHAAVHHYPLLSGQIFVNDSFALDSTWIRPGDSGLLHQLEKPPVLEQVALTLSRPTAASRPRPALVLGPPPMPGGCHSSLKPISNGPSIAFAAAAAAAAAAMVSVDPEGLRGPSPSSLQPCHFLTLAPIKIPLRTAPFSGRHRPRCCQQTPPPVRGRACWLCFLVPACGQGCMRCGTCWLFF